MGMYFRKGEGYIYVRKVGENEKVLRGDLQPLQAGMDACSTLSEKTVSCSR
jgi:hypothetical protein